MTTEFQSGFYAQMLVAAGYCVSETRRKVLIANGVSRSSRIFVVTKNCKFPFLICIRRRGETPRNACSRYEDLRLIFEKIKKRIPEDKSEVSFLRVALMVTPDSSGWLLSFS